MKKTTLTILAFLSIMTGVMAQSIQDGMGHLYAKRYKSAVDVFQKLIAANPNNIDAIYWLGQAYFNMDDNAAARQTYEKALASNGSAPLILVGIGHADLLDNKPTDARMRFEQAITASRTKKGDDPIVQTAIGRAIVDSKTGDFNYAVQLLESATSKDPKNTESWLQLGNAYRKAGAGEGGGKAFQAYKKALEANPAFAVADVRLAKLFESQKNWELVLMYLNEAVTRDAKFTDAYYELFWYNFYRSNFADAKNYFQKYIDSKLPETDIQDDYLSGQLCYVSKDYDCAITQANNVINALGERAKPRMYKLAAYAYYDKGDYPNALVNVNKYLVKEKPEEIIAADWKLKANIIIKTGGTDDEIYNTYMKAVDADSLLTNKVDFLKTLGSYFKDAKKRDWEAKVRQKIIETKPKPTLNDYFDLVVAHYFTPNYLKSRETALVMREKFADQVYGYEWAFNNSRVIDTVRKDSIAVPDALQLYDFSAKDTLKYRKQLINSSSFLAIYYANDVKDKDKALDYLKKWQSADTAHAADIQKNIDILMKAPAPKPTTPTRSTTTPKPTGNKPVAVKPKAPVKKSVAKNK